MPCSALIEPPARPPGQHDVSTASSSPPAHHVACTLPSPTWPNRNVVAPGRAADNRPTTSSQNPALCRGQRHVELVHDPRLAPPRVGIAPAPQPAPVAALGRTAASSPRRGRDGAARRSTGSSARPPRPAGRHPRRVPPRLGAQVAGHEACSAGHQLDGTDLRQAPRRSPASATARAPTRGRPGGRQMGGGPTSASDSVTMPSVPSLPHSSWARS